MRGNGAMQIGYMRISKGEQTTALQEDVLAKVAVEKIYRDAMSGVYIPRFYARNLHRSLGRYSPGSPWFRLFAYQHMDTDSARRILGCTLVGPIISRK